MTVTVYRTRPRLDGFTIAVLLGLIPGVAATFVVATLYMARGMA